MFSLVVMCVVLVLMAALAGAAVFYGSSAGVSGRASAEAASLLGQSAQIVSASTAYANDHYGAKPGTLDALVGEHYLSTVPPGWLDPQGDVTPLTSKAIESERACVLFNAKQNIEGIPRCSEVGELTTPVCCQ
jgi:hypothetical protein